MKITKNSVVSLDFELKNGEGELLDASDENGPMMYLHGANNIPDGLEKALEGKAAGDALDVNLKPEEGFGEYNDELVQEVKRSDIEGVDDLEPGLQFPAETEDGIIHMTVLEVEGDKVVLDGNHPLAGEELNFKITVGEVREATAEELEHGHAHGPDGHHH